jgi:hypothetical protein
VPVSRANAAAVNVKVRITVAVAAAAAASAIAAKRTGEADGCRACTSKWSGFADCLQTLGTSRCRMLRG